MNKILTLTLLLIMTIQQAWGQEKDCLTASIDSIRRATYPGLGTNISFESWIAKRIRNTNIRNQTTIYRIPVVVHIVHNGEAIGEGANISQAQVQSQIDVLNEDFRRLEGSNGFNDHPDGVDVGIEFYLVKTDPEGNPLSEPGVDRVDGGREIWPTGISQSIELQLKPITIWDPERYFNIWTVNFGGFIGRSVLGYAQFPDMSGLEGLDELEGSAETDGIVVGYHYFGSSEKGNFPLLRAPYDLGRTATHEVGHWLGLRHIWGDGDCDVDDFVMDTPLAAEPSRGCPNEEVITCAQPSMFENYMDYTDDGCVNIFTLGQKERIIAVLENSPRRPYTIEEVLSVGKENNNDLLVYPNPATDFVLLKSGSISTSTTIRILSASGSVMTDYHHCTVDEGVLEIDVSRIPSGVYFLQIQTDYDRKIKRLIVAK